MTDIRPLRHSWDDLTAKEDVSTAEKAVDANFFAVFTTAEGRKALENMHLLTTWKRNTPNSSDGALRESEAQRRFVAILEARIERHAKRVTTQSGRRSKPQSESGDRPRRTRTRRGDAA